MHRLDSSDLPSTSRKRLLASSVGTVMPPMLNINCNENGETDYLIFITGMFPLFKIFYYYLEWLMEYSMIFYVYVF